MSAYSGIAGKGPAEPKVQETPKHITYQDLLHSFRLDSVLLMEGSILRDWGVTSLIIMAEGP